MQHDIAVAVCDYGLIKWNVDPSEPYCSIARRLTESVTVLPYSTDRYDIAHYLHLYAAPLSLSHNTTSFMVQ